MKKVNWIIEDFIFDDYKTQLIDIIKDSNSNVFIYDESDSRYCYDFLRDNFDETDILISHVSLQTGRNILKSEIGYPGIYLTLDNYECYKYYGYYGDHLLNSKYLMMGLNDVHRNKDYIFDIFNSGKIFIRPSNGYKSFTGQLLNKKTFEFDYQTLINSYGGIDTNQLVLLAPPQNIINEYRFIVIDGEVITGSLYIDIKNKGTYEPYFDKINDDKKAYNYAVKLSKLYQPDLAYTIDICKLENGDYKLIEINSLCCANWYGADYGKIVKSLNQLCIKDYNEIFY